MSEPAQVTRALLDVQGRTGAITHSRHPGTTREYNDDHPVRWPVISPTVGIDGPREPPDGDDPERPSAPEIHHPVRTADHVATEREQKFGSRTIQRLVVEFAHTDGTGERGPGHWAEVENVDRRPECNHIHLTEERIHHILIRDIPEESGGHRHGSGVPEKTTFPPDWDDRKILSAILDVARNPDWPPVLQRHGTWLAEGWRDDVHIVAIIRRDGSIRSGFPEKGKGVHVNDKGGHPILAQWPETE